MSATYVLNARQQFLDLNGNPLASGSVGMYIPNTLTPSNTWQDAAQTTLNANPIPLDAGGWAMIYGSGQYRQIVKDSLGNTIWDRVVNVGDSSIAGPTAAPATTMGIDFRYTDGVANAPSSGGLWSGYSFAGRTREKQFTATNAPGAEGTGSASAGLDYAEAHGTAQDVVAHTGIAWAKSNSSTVFGGNDMVLCDNGLTGIRYVGREIDLQPAAGTTPANGCIGLAINAFSVQIPGDAIYINGVSGGSFSSGIRVGPLSSSGAGLHGEGAMGSLISSSTGTYAQDAIVLTNGHKVRYSGTTTSHAKIYNDGSNNWRFVLGTGSLLWRDNLDATTLGSIDSSGNGIFAGNLTASPPASATPANNGQMTFQLTSNTSLVIKVKGSDGTVRSTTLTLA